MIYIGLPAYNEEAAIDLVISQTLKALNRTELDFKIVVFNDGSTDRTLELVHRWAERFPDRVEALDGGRNQGLGVAVKNLIQTVIDRTEPPSIPGPDQIGQVDDWLAHAAGDNEDALVIMDADCTQTPEMIEPMVRRIHQGFDLAIASRYRPDSRIKGVSRLRRFLSWGASLMMRTLFPFTGVRDYTTGYRCYSAAILHRLREAHGEAIVTETGFACMSEILLKIRRLGAVASEVPLVLRYDAKPSPSKMRVAKTIRQVFGVMWRWGIKR